MAKLSMYLPPFSPDYSGACAVLFDLKTVTAMHDASGCTGNYTGFDDPRWYGSASGIFCSGLRELDAILGDDEKLEKKMLEAANYLSPDLLAVVGSPVPMVIGSDLDGIASELESLSQLPCFGFATTGINYYDVGAFMAAKALIDRFMDPAPSLLERGPASIKEGPIRVNLCGALPMDFGKGEDLEVLKTLLEKQGYEIGLSLAMGYSLEELKMGARAQVNLALSRFGYLASAYMEQKFGIPFLAGYPAGEEGAKLWFTALKEVLSTGKSQVLLCPGKSLAFGQAPELFSKEKKLPLCLILGEQVMGNSLRLALWAKGYKLRIQVGCLFKREEAIALEGDLNLEEEEDILKAVNNPEVAWVIADPLVGQLLQKENVTRFSPLSQYAISSKVGLKDKHLVTAGYFDRWLEEQGITRDTFPL